MGPVAAAPTKLHYMLERVVQNTRNVSPSFDAMALVYTGKILHLSANQQEIAAVGSQTAAQSSETNTWRNSKRPDGFPPYLPLHIKSVDRDFLDWFIGFTEGDGSFGLSWPKGSQGTPRHDFIINQKDPKALYKIRTNLGFGTIKKYNDSKQGTSYYRYIVSASDDILKLIHIFNGNLILNKTRKRYAEWCSTFFQRPSVIHKGLRIDLLDHNSRCSLDNAWLSGFSEAEGCFSATNSQRDVITVRFIIDQKHESELLLQIKSLFGMGCINLRSDDGMERFVLGKEGYPKVVQYFSRFPLRGQKHISFKRWHKICIRLDDNIDRPKGSRRLARLLRLVNNINTPTSARDLR